MADLKNKELIKVMWLPNQEEFLFRMQDETSLSKESPLYLQIYQHVDTVKWKKEYSQKYYDWLNKDDNSIFDINDAANMLMINGLIEVNRVLENEELFYWFDIDRTFDDHFVWEYCPISNKKLVHLGEKFSKHNALISPDYPLVFPLQ